MCIFNFLISTKPFLPFLLHIARQDDSKCASPLLEARVFFLVMDALEEEVAVLKAALLNFFGIFFLKHMDLERALRIHFYKAIKREEYYSYVLSRPSPTVPPIRGKVDLNHVMSGRGRGLGVVINLCDDSDDEDDLQIQGVVTLDDRLAKGSRHAIDLREEEEEEDENEVICLTRAPPSSQETERRSSFYARMARVDELAGEMESETSVSSERANKRRRVVREIEEAEDVEEDASPAEINELTGPLTTYHLLHRVQQNLTVEEEKPDLLICDDLRDYQKQSLAFMLERERSEGYRVRGGFLCDEVGMGKTVVVIALILANRRNQISRYDAARLWIDSEPKLSAEYRNVRNALERELHEERVLPYYDSRIKLKHVRDNTRRRRIFRELESERLNHEEDIALWKLHRPYVEIKTTIVIAPCTLLGQWRDEIRKFAPSLKVCIFHSSDNRTKRSIESGHTRLNEVDVLLCTKMTGPPKMIRRGALSPFRIVYDESHVTCINCSRWMGICAKRIWCVTGTPFKSSASSIRAQLEVLGHNKETGLALGPYCASLDNKLHDEKKKKRSFVLLAKGLRKLMIRHTKDQLLKRSGSDDGSSGDVALALPTLSCETVMLEMYPEERKAYDKFSLEELEKAGKGVMFEKGATVFGLQQGLLLHQRMCAGDFHDNYWRTRVSPRDSIQLLKLAGASKKTASKLRSKTAFLLDDLQKLKRVEPNMHVVIFTMHNNHHERIVFALKSVNLFDSLCEFSGATAINVRHKNIRDFQRVEANKSKVAIITMRIGNCGVNLQRATRVYLMEPCVDPAMEIQAAGRIHRMGQDRPVHVKRLVFSRTFEHNVVEFHRRLETGASTGFVNGRLAIETVRLLVRRPEDISEEGEDENASPNNRVESNEGEQ